MKRLLEDYIENVDTEDLVTKELKNSDDFVKMTIKDWYLIAYELGCSHILTVYVSQIQAMTTLRGWIKQTLRVLNVLGIEHTTPQLLGLYDHDLPIVEDLKNAPDLDFKDIKDDPVIDQIGNSLYMAIKVGIIGLEDNQSGVKTLLKILTFMPYDGYGRNTVHLNLRRPFKTANPRSIGFMRHAGEFVACDQYRFLSMILSYKKAHKDIPGDYLERSQAANNITDGIVLSNVFPGVPKHTIHDLVERYLQTLIKS